MEEVLKAGHCVDPAREMQEPDMLAWGDTLARTSKKERMDLTWR